MQAPATASTSFIMSKTRNFVLGFLLPLNRSKQKQKNMHHVTERHFYAVIYSVKTSEKRNEKVSLLEIPLFHLLTKETNKFFACHHCLKSLNSLLFECFLNRPPAIFGREVEIKRVRRFPNKLNSFVIDFPQYLTFSYGVNCIELHLLLDRPHQEHCASVDLMATMIEL